MSFFPVVELPKDYRVFDFSGGDYSDQTLRYPYGVGKYNEKRPGIYSAPLFGGIRDVHVGIDLFAPVGTPVHAFSDATILHHGYNSAAGDYGGTVVIEVALGPTTPLYALYGHLSRSSLTALAPGQRLARGEAFALIGDRHENGGYPPHLHFQLSFERPTGPDLPGAVADADRELALLKYPDPRLVLGPLY